ncbi:dihydrofolate reductase family protein [Methylosarcina fibrata]|uniref:dihydrofolate reductase family protein n=1 Tax=Methylosarcina fibrata TaxID=105972 RepID=UPI0018DED5C4|nr:dihydrofolate reductase family protein [Methylosarcina fibrata]
MNSIAAAETRARTGFGSGVASRYDKTRRREREPWGRPGGTTFYFVNDGPESALEQARESAGGRDIRISGGAEVIQQYLNLDVINELEIALAPVMFGRGRRLFDNLREPLPRFRIDKVLDSPAATHLRYVRE